MPRKRTRYNNRQKKTFLQNSSTRELQPVVGGDSITLNSTDQNDQYKLENKKEIEQPEALSNSVEDLSENTSKTAAIPNVSSNSKNSPKSIDTTTYSNITTNTENTQDLSNSLSTRKNASSDADVIKSVDSKMFSETLLDEANDTLSYQTVSQATNNNPLLFDAMATKENQHSVTVHNTDENSNKSFCIESAKRNSLSNFNDSFDDLSKEFGSIDSLSCLDKGFDVEVRNKSLNEGEGTNNLFKGFSTGEKNKQTPLIINKSSGEMSENSSDFQLEVAEATMSGEEVNKMSLQQLQQEIRFLKNENALYKEQINRMEVPPKIKLLYRQLFSKKRKLKELEDKLVAESLEKEKIIEQLKSSYPQNMGDILEDNGDKCEKCEKLIKEIQQCESIKQKFKELSSTCNYLNNELKLCREANSTFQDKITKIEREKIELLDKIETISTASKEREARLEMYKLNYNTAKEELSILQSRNHDLSVRISQLNAKDELSIYKKQYLDVNNQLKNSKTQLTDAERTVSSLNTELFETKRLLDTLQRDKQILQKRLDEISTLNSKITTNNSEFHRVMKEQISKTKDLEEKHQRKVDEAYRFRIEMNEKETRVNEEMSKNKFLSAEIAELKTKLKNESLKILEKEKANEALKNKYENTKNNLATLTNEIKELNKQVLCLKNDNENLKTKNVNLLNVLDSRQQQPTDARDDENSKLKSETKKLNLYLDEILHERHLASSVKNDCTLLDKLQAICVQLNRVEWRKTNSENKVEKLELQIRILEEKNNELSTLNERYLVDKKDFLALLEKQNAEIKELRESTQESRVILENADDPAECEALKSENEYLKENCENLNDLLESMVVENQELKAKFLELGLTGFPLISPPVYNEKVEETEANSKKKAKNYEQLYKDSCEEISGLKECIKKYRDEVESISDLLESVVVENRRLKMAQWSSNSDC